MYSDLGNRLQRRDMTFQKRRFRIRVTPSTATSELVYKNTNRRRYNIFGQWSISWDVFCSQCCPFQIPVSSGGVLCQWCAQRFRASCCCSQRCCHLHQIGRGRISTIRRGLHVPRLDLQFTDQDRCIWTRCLRMQAHDILRVVQGKGRDDACWHTSHPIHLIDVETNQLYSMVIVDTISICFAVPLVRTVD